MRRKSVCAGPPPTNPVTRINFLCGIIVYSVTQFSRVQRIVSLATVFVTSMMIVAFLYGHHPENLEGRVITTVLAALVMMPCRVWLPALFGAANTLPPLNSWANVGVSAAAKRIMYKNGGGKGGKARRASAVQPVLLSPTAEATARKPATASERIAAMRRAKPEQGIVGIAIGGAQRRTVPDSAAKQDTDTPVFSSSRRVLALAKPPNLPPTGKTPNLVKRNGRTAFGSDRKIRQPPLGGTEAGANPSGANHRRCCKHCVKRPCDGLLFSACSAPSCR